MVRLHDDITPNPRWGQRRSIALFFPEIAPSSRTNIEGYARKHTPTPPNGCRFPTGRIRAVAPKIGGGFGAKGGLHVQHLAAALALKTGRPVEMVLSRVQDF
jgi:hypothetical protein